MARYNRVLSIENGTDAGMINQDGLAIGFTSMDEMSRITGLDFTSKYKVHYEPAALIFMDQDGDSGQENIPYDPYEDLIDIIDILLVRQADPIYGHGPADALRIAKEVKYANIDAACNEKIVQAESNPEDSVVYSNPYAGMARRTNRQNHLSNKKNADDDLSQNEKDESKVYQKLTEHIGKLYDASDKGKTDVDKLDVATDVMAFDVEADINWPEWVPPTRGEV